MGEEYTLDLYNLIGIEKPELEPMLGNRMTAVGTYKSMVFLDKHSQFLRYEYKFIKSRSKPLFFVNGTKHIVKVNIL